MSLLPVAPDLARRQAPADDAAEIAKPLSVSSEWRALAIAVLTAVLLLVALVAGGYAWIGRTTIVDLRL